MKNVTIKTSLAILAFLVISQFSFAQLNFGVRAGVNIANMNFDLDGVSLEPSSIIGINVGALLNIGVTEDFSVQPEVNFIQKGSKIDETDLTPEFKTTFNFIEIPVLAKYAFGGESIGGFVQAGPSFGFALNGTNKAGDESEDIDFDEDGIKRTDFGLQFGAGISFGNFFVDARYLLGLANLDDSGDDSVTTKTNGINIGVGYMFGGK